MNRKKRTWSVEEKLAILKEAEEKGMVATCRKHGIYQTCYYYWKEKYDAGGEEALKLQYVKRNDRELLRTQRENKRLKQLLAEKDLQLQLKDELLKKKLLQWRR